MTRNHDQPIDKDTESGANADRAAKPFERGVAREDAAARLLHDDDRPRAKGDMDTAAHETGHPVGRVVGAAGGAAAGAVSGIAAGPVGSAAGAVAGAALGALSGGGGDGRAEQGTHAPRDAAQDGRALRDASPATYRFAFHYGQDAHERFGPGAKWDDVVPTLRRQWEHERQRALPTWGEVEQAIYEGWRASPQENR